MSSDKSELKPKERRSHAARSAETREKIITAVVECIAELGLKKTTTNAIADKAGVTWGALQHHFGGLNGCLIAAFNDSFQRFVVTLGEPPRDIALEERVSVFVDRAWQHYSSRHYLSMFQLLLNDMSSVEDDKWQQSQLQIVVAMDEVWKNFFEDVVPDIKKRRMLARYTHSVLTGFAVSYSYDWGGNRMQEEVVLLKQSLFSQMV